MKIIYGTDLSSFKTRGGATDTKNIILDNNKEEEFLEMVRRTYPNGVGEVQLNGSLWFDSALWFKVLNIDVEVAKTKQ